ncbi:LacI family DNA-binding transcriptional regulator [Lentzea sp. BCCO 10_0061]|uniref:LacI family DNA-binding transcriptional regulator n=1 Tax=Lentzea sokolovensis TaxID=3095429 RepID=A0ABU4USG3_9PSEU|nr:LacI family DNA-binding transcriptional regulator [Lentzea sp. BCCO 10_0061]MDX8142437.1 LacI family DNA-binding transcriptional regulator [Lentzea sp. BCCO 10_0061]
MTGERTATLDDVARAAGVSRATASRVVTGQGPASPRARDRVAAAVAALGYVPDASARALVTRTGTRLAIAVIGHTAAVLDDPYVGRVLTSAAHVAAEREVGVSLHWLPLDDPGSLARLADGRGLGGLVVVNPTRPALETVPRGLRGRVAAVGVGTRHVPSFDVDNRAGTDGVVRHLVRTGRRRIAMITGPSWLPCGDRAVDAYRKVLRDSGGEPRVVTGDFTAARGAEAAAEIMVRWPDTDAVFALSDLTALGVLDGLHALGVRVPGDVAVAGFDDIAFAGLSRPALTTSTHPVEDIAAAAAQAVLDRRDTSGATFYPSALVVRDSA